MPDIEVLDALAQGHREHAAANFDASQEWFERALRIAPGDATVLLALAGTLLAKGLPECRAIYEQVASANDVREAWLGLAVANLHHRRPTEAAGALGAVLSQHAHAIADIAAVAGHIDRH